MGSIEIFYNIMFIDNIIVVLFLNALLMLVAVIKLWQIFIKFNITQ